MACIFCNIINKVEPAFIIYEDENVIAFLDKRPLFKGHSLLLPKEHVETLYDLSEIKLAPLFSIGKMLGKAIEHGLQAQGSFIAINNRISQSVPHLHIHLVPRNQGDGLKGFFWPRYKYKSVDEQFEIQAQIKKYIEKNKF